MEKLGEYNLSLIVIDEKYHLYDLLTFEIYEAMSLEYIKQLLDMWNKKGQCLYNYDIIVLTI